MFEALGSRTYRYRYLIVAAWIAAAILSFKLAPSIASQGSADQAAFLPASAPSAIANEAIAKAFPGSTSTTSATLTFSRDSGLTDADIAYRDAFAAWITSAEAPTDLRDAVTSVDTATSRPELASMLASSDGQLQLVNVNLDVSSAGDEAAAVVAALRDHVAATAPQGLAVHVTGSAGITTDYLQAIKDGTASTTAVTVVLVLVILLLIYRAPLAALVPLATIGGAFLVARGVLGVLAAAGWQISSLLDTFVVVLVFGVGTDYTIFLISRYREEVREGEWHDASRRTVRRIGAVISASAATVIVGLGAMAFGDFEMIRSTGPALAVAIFVTLIAGLTLAPALLGIFGHYLFWPLHARTGSDVEPEGFFARLAGIVTSHPGLVTAIVVGALAIPALYLPQMRTNFDTLAELPAASDARAGFDVVAAHLGKGKLVQSTGLVETGSGADILAPSSLAHLRDTLATLSSTPGVGSVTSLITPAGDGVVPDAFKPSAQLTTIAGSFASSASGPSGSAGSSSSALLDPKVSSGLSDALDYVDALGVAFPDVAARSEFRAATTAISSAQAIVEQAKAQSVVSTQLRTLSAALTSPTAIAGASSGSSGASDTTLIRAYLDELATAYPEVRDLAAFSDASVAAAGLERAPSAAAAIAAANGLDALAVHFDAQPDATLAATSLASTPAALEAKQRATAAFAAIPGAMHDLGAVFAVRSDDIFVPVGLGGPNASELQQAVDAFVSADRTATRFYLTASGDPYSTSAFEMTRLVQDELAAAAPSFGQGATAALDGPTAQLADVQTVLQSDFQRVGVITVIGIFVVLAILLRAIVAPLYLVATVLLSYASAVGLSAWLFQVPMGDAGVSFYLPLLVFVLLVALGSDYNIFLMSRVREESETRPIREGIRIASGHTGAVITSAGLILAGTFGSMASAPLAVLFQIGVAVAIGVLIDTFVVRSILVPAITTLVGDRAWWPSGLRLGGLVPAGVAAAPASAVLASVATEAPTGRSSARVAAAIILAILVPVTFAGLLIWARPATGSPAVHGAIVDADTGATMTAADGSTRRLALGADLAAALEKGGPSAVVRWTTSDAAAAATGLDDGTYAVVLTIPAGYSSAVAAIQADRTGSQLAPTLHLQTGDATGATTQAVAREISDAVSSAATAGATSSYVADLLLAVSSTQSSLSDSATTANDLATRTSTLASDAGGVGTVAGELVSGLDALASGTSSAVSGAATLASATSSLANGAKQLSAGARVLTGGLSSLDAQTSGLPDQAAALDAGAAALAAGAGSADSGAASLSAGLDTLRTQTTGLGAQVSALDSGAAGLDAGATALAAGAAGLATNADQLGAMTSGYTTSVSGLAATCGTSGADAAFCSQLSAIAAQGAGLDALASGVASGARELSTGTPGVSTGAAGLAAGAAGLHSGTSDLAAGAPALESGIADAASGAATLATGTAGVAAGATQVADGVHQLAAGMPALADGVASLSSAASQVASGASSVASGAGSLAAGTTASAAGASQLSAAMRQVVDGAKVVQAETGRLAQDGTALATDAAGAASALDTASAASPTYPADARASAAGNIATPVGVETVASDGAAPTGLAPYIAALALWLGALAALVVLPAGRRRIGRRAVAAPLAAFAGAGLLAAVAAMVMVGGLLLVGLSVARLPELLGVSLVAAVTFVAIVQALVVAFGRRGWLVGLLFAGIQVAASGLVYPVDALPGPLAALHPLVPMTWASDALTVAIGGGTGSIGTAVVVLTGWLLASLVITLAMVVERSRRDRSEASGLGTSTPGATEAAGA
jgi:RND superfamily putative drug exporter